MKWLFVAFAFLDLVIVHGPDGQEIDLNPAEISSIRRPKENSEDYFAKDANCLIIMTNGKLISTIETCAEIIKKVSKSLDNQ